MKKDSIKKSMIYNSIGSMIYLFCQWLVTFIVVWLSGYGAAGLLSLAMSITNTFSVISTFNMRNYQSSDVEGKYSEKTYIVTRLITTIMAIVITLIYSFVKKFAINEVLCINIYMLYKMTESIVDVLHGSMQKKWRFDIIGLSYSIRGILTIVAFSLGLLITKDLIWSLILMTLVVYLFVILFDIRKYKKEFKVLGDFHFNSMISLLLMCLPLVIYGILANYTAMNPRIFTLQKFGEKVLGYYASVATPALIIQVAASFIFNPLITLFADFYKEKNMKGFYTTLVRVIAVVLIIGITGIIVSNFLGDFALKLLYGPKILKYSYLLNGVVLVSVLTAFIWFLGMVLTVARNYFSLMFGAIISLVFSFVLTPILINKYGLDGINYTLIISYLSQVFVYLISILKIKSNYEKSRGNIVYVRSTSIVNDSRASKEINTLVKNGFNVFVLGWDRDSRIDDYRDVRISDNKINVKFFKFKCGYGASKRTMIGLLLFQVWLFVKLCFRHNRFEYIHACDFDCGFVSSMVCKMFGKKLVYDMYDYYSDSRAMPLKVQNIIEKLENGVIDSSYASIICAEWRREQIKGTNPRRLAVIHNTPDAYIISDKKVIKSNSKKIKIVYVGILQDNRLIMEVLNELKGNDKYEVHIGGFGIYEDDIKKLAKKYDNIYFYGSLKYSDVLALERDADLLFATYSPKIKNHKFSAPNKVYEAMALEKPLIVCEGTGVDKMVVKEGIGKAIKYDSKDFALKVDEIFNDKKLLKRIQNNERKLYKEKYSWEIMENILTEIYEEKLED